MEKIIVLILIIGLLLIGWLISFLLMRRRYEREFAGISDAISQMINHKELDRKLETRDTLPSKISHQLIRLQEIQLETERKMKRQQDNTQKLITEIAHQLRNPLMNIQNYLMLLDSGELTSDQRSRYLQAIKQSEERLSFLTEGFIKMSRFENELIQLHPNSTEVRETVLQAVFEVSRKAEEKNIEIEVRQEKEIPAEHDTNWLREAIFNVLENSVKYSQENSQIIISLTQNQMFTEISVRDYGIGIDPQEEADIFQRFYRGSRVTNQEGFGIGLYLSREIVLKHGGFIKVKRENPGLTVSVFLP